MNSISVACFLFVELILGFFVAANSYAATVTGPFPMGSKVMIILAEKDGAEKLFNLLPSHSEQHWVQNFPEDHLEVEYFRRTARTSTCQKILDSRNKTGGPSYKCTIELDVKPD